MSRSPWIVVVLVVFALPYIASDVCSMITACSCMFPNGTGIDLAPATTLNYTSTTVSQQQSDTTKSVSINTYYYFPCVDSKPNINDTSVGKNCNRDLAICQHKYELNMTLKQNDTSYITNVDNEYNFCGSNKNVTISNDGRSINYKHQTSYTTVVLECLPYGQSNVLIVDDREPDRSTFYFYSPHACMKQIQEVSTRSTGSTLLIILFTFLLVYLVLGVGTKKFLMGAQGLEVIPNIGFWRDLPALCRDGWLFLRNGCTVPRDATVGPTSPDPNSYDSI